MQLRKNILFVAPNYKNRKGGVASVLTTYSKEIENFNFSPSVYFNSVVINFILFPINILSFLFKLLVDEKIDIVHIHGASRGSFYRKYIFFLIAQYLFNKPVVYHIHGAEYHIFYENANKITKTCIDKMINESAAVLVLSAEWLKYFKSRFKQKKLFVLNNIIQRVTFLEKGQIKNEVNFLFLGRIGKRKGVFDLIQSIIDNRQYLEGKVKFSIGGDGDVENLKNLIENYNLNNIVEYKGWVNSHRKNKLLSQNHILILPSYNEGLPISLLEAMSFSMPIISTKVGGIPQILKDGFNGKFVEPGNTNEIFEAIKFYIENKPLILEHGQNSYHLAQNYFPEKVLGNLQDIYIRI
jgi:glycosyltransferase involved in cell wall biosynthesis